MSANAAVVGPWVQQKHDLITHYVRASAAARRKFTSRTEATYLDPYCGPASAVVRGTGTHVDGSAVCAWKASVASNVPFTHLCIGDTSAEVLASTEATLKGLRAPVRSAVGSAEVTVPQFCAQLNPASLHFALLDPFDLDLPFVVLECLAKLQRIDMIIHLSTGDMQRNIVTYAESNAGKLEAFAPGWRKVVPVTGTSPQLREGVINYWFSLIKKLNLQTAPQMHRVRNSTNSTMYWLIFVSRAAIARRLWGVAESYTNPQTSTFDFGS